MYTGNMLRVGIHVNVINHLGNVKMNVENQLVFELVESEE